MEIRLAKLEDSNRIHELLEYIFNFHYNHRKDIFIGGSKYNIEEIEKLIVDPSHIIYILEDNGYVCGYCINESSIMANGKKVLFIHDLCVDEKYQGKGFGKQLMEYTKKYAIDNDYDRIELRVWEFNDHAYKMYESLGFKTQSRILENKLK